MATVKREYEETHPWLIFRADLKRAPRSLWMNLGAIKSKCEHVANVMLPPKMSRELLQVYLAKGVRATAAIEGNTLSEDEVLRRVRGEGQSELPKSKEYQGVEIDNIIRACNLIHKTVLGAQDEQLLLTVDKIKEYNRLVLEGLSLEEGEVAGAVSRRVVGVASYRGAPRADCDYLLQRLCHWINEEIKPPSKDEELAFGVLRAILAHLYLAWIHPFPDGNGRTARLMEFHILLAAGVPNVAAHLLSNHYNQTRQEYYRQLDYTSRSNGVIVPFVEYAAQGLFDGLNEAIQYIQHYQWEVSWRDYVYRTFSDMSGKPAERRRRVALDLWFKGPEGMPVSKLRTLSPQVAEMYAGKTRKTVTRDLNRLESMNLIRRRGRMVCARGDVLFGFLPDRRTG